MQAIARNLGAKNQDRVDRIAAHTIFFTVDSCDYFYTGWNFFDEAVLADVLHRMKTC